jgi:hypothetical protein
MPDTTWVPASWFGAVVARRDIAGTRVCAGDVLTTYRRRGVICLAVTPDELEVLREASAWNTAGPDPAVRPVFSDMTEVARSIYDRRCGRRPGKDGTVKPVLWIVRRVQPSAVTPIRAGSDDAALFELVCAAGGRLT